MNVSESKIPTHILFVDNVPESRLSTLKDIVTKLPGYIAVRWTARRTFIEFSTVENAVRGRATLMTAYSDGRNIEMIKIFPNDSPLKLGYARGRNRSSYYGGQWENESSVSHSHHSTGYRNTTIDDLDNGKHDVRQKSSSTGYGSYSLGHRPDLKPERDDYDFECEEYERDERYGNRKYYDDEQRSINDRNRQDYHHRNHHERGNPSRDRSRSRSRSRSNTITDQPIYSVTTEARHNYAPYPNDNNPSVTSTVKTKSRPSLSSTSNPSIPSVYEDIITPDKYDDDLMYKELSPDTATSSVIALPSNASRILHVRNIPLNTTERELAHIFRPYPGYLHTTIPEKLQSNILSGRSQARKKKDAYPLYSFVEFTSPEAANHARLSLEGYVLDRKQENSPVISIAFAHSSTSRRICSTNETDGNTSSSLVRNESAGFYEENHYVSFENTTNEVLGTDDHHIYQQQDDYGTGGNEGHYQDDSSMDPSRYSSNSNLPLSASDPSRSSLSSTLVPGMDARLMEVLSILAQTDPQRLLQTLSNHIEVHHPSPSPTATNHQSTDNLSRKYPYSGPNETSSKESNDSPVDLPRLYDPHIEGENIQVPRNK